MPKTATVKINDREDVKVKIDVKKVDDSVERDIKLYKDNLLLTDSQIEVFENESEKYNGNINSKLIKVSIICGALSGGFDLFFEKSLSFEKAHEWGKDKIDEFILFIADQTGFKGGDIVDAIGFLEKDCPILSDRAINEMGGARQHHLRDFSHHPTIIGAVFSILSQFTGKAYGTNTKGEFFSTNIEDVSSYMGENFTEKIYNGIVQWFLHLVSDMGGSSDSRKYGREGTGIPGPLLSTIKELSSTKLFKRYNNDGNKELSVEVSRLFNGTKIKNIDKNGNVENIKFDLRTEIGLVKQFADQTIPILITNCIIRASYFIVSLLEEIKLNNVDNVEDLYKIDIEKVIPFSNAKVTRMLLITNATRESIDVTASALSAYKNGNFDFDKFLANINIVGVCDLTLLFYLNTKDGLKKHKANINITNLKSEKLYIQSSIINTKLKGIYKTIEDKTVLLDKIQNEIQFKIQDCLNTYERIEVLNDEINRKVKNIDKELREDIRNILH